MVIIVIGHILADMRCVFAEHDGDGRGRSPQPHIRRWFDFWMWFMFVIVFDALFDVFDESINETHSAHSNNARARNASHHPVHVISWHPDHQLWSEHDAVTHWCWISVMHWLYELASLVLPTDEPWCIVWSTAPTIETALRSLPQGFASSQAIRCFVHCQLNVNQSMKAKNDGMHTGEYQG